MTDQPSTLFTDLRASTCKMLGLDPANLSALESLRTDMVCSLRLECDRIMAQQLRGEPCDLRALTMATEALQNMLRPAFTAAADHDREGAAATAELERLVDGVRMQREHELGEAMVREEMMAAAAAAMPVSEESLNPGFKLPAPETLPTVGNAQQPSSNVHTTYIDAEVLKEPEPEHPLRSHSLNNPTSQSRPRSPLTTSAYSPFAAWSAGQNGVKRWEPPPGW